MNFPVSNRLELPILQELAVMGGAEDVRFLYDRLISYFPQLDKKTVQNGKLEKWRLHVQRAGKDLDDAGFIKRARGMWTLTNNGAAFVAAENTEFAVETINLQIVDQTEFSHQQVQTMLCEIGEILGFDTQPEFEYYDVVWRVNPRSPRLSHVFEVQHKGNIDSAFAKLKKAHEAQRSKPFLILASERDTNRALRSISFEQSGAFHELAESLTILSFTQIEQLHRSLKSVGEILPVFLTS